MIVSLQPSSSPYNRELRLALFYYVKFKIGAVAARPLDIESLNV